MYPQPIVFLTNSHHQLIKPAYLIREKRACEDPHGGVVLVGPVALRDRQGHALPAGQGAVREDVHVHLQSAWKGPQVLAHTR